MCGLLYVKPVSIYVLSTQFSVVVAFTYDTISHFFPFSEVSFHLIQCTCRSFRSRTVMAHHKSHFSPIQAEWWLWNIWPKRCLTAVTACFICASLRREGWELWLTRYKNRAVKIQIFILSSSKIQIWRVEAKSYHQCRKICPGEPFNKCCGWTASHQRIGDDWGGPVKQNWVDKKRLHGRNKRGRRSQPQKPEGPESSDEGQLPETPSNLGRPAPTHTQTQTHTDKEQENM